jgi:Phosphoesterase family
MTRQQTPRACSGYPVPPGGRRRRSDRCRLLSPFIKPGTVTTVAYNHYSYLRSMEDIFGLPHLGYAAQEGLAAFGPDIFTAMPPAAGRGPPSG